MSVDDILKIIDSIATYIVYFYPGYISLYVYHFLKAKTLKDEKGTIAKSIVISFLYKICVDRFQISSEIAYHFCMIGVSTVVPYIAHVAQKSDVCPICKGLDDKHFKVDDMMPGENAPPMHPNCHCSTAAYMDNEAYEEWINSYQEHGLNFEDWKASRESEESKKKYKYADTVVKKSLLTSSEYRKKFNQVSGNSKVNRRAWNISKDMLSHRSGTKFEDLAFINVVNGKYAVNKDYDVESKANMNKQMKQLLEESEPETIIAIHNHPGSSVPSLADLMTCVKRGYNFGLVACHDGKVYKYWVDKNKFNSVNAGFALDRMETQGYDKEVRTWLEQAGVYLEVW